MAVPDCILASWGPGETRIAVMSGDEVLEVSLVRPSMITGSVILGRIVGSLPTGNSVFVDIGQDRPGFLSIPPKAGAKRSEGQAVLVQVRSDAAHGKGATLGQEITFPGRLLAYTTSKPGIQVSRRLDDQERERLQAQLAPLLTEAEGVSIRTAAQGCTQDQMEAELAHLRRQWQQMQEAKSQARPPQVLWSPDPIDRVLALHPQIQHIRVDDPAHYAQLRAHLGELVVLDRTIAPILDEAIEEAIAPVIDLPDGGRVSFGAHAALIAIDVDSGGGPVPAANAQAVRQIARQIRLRGLGGQMVVDFIPHGGKGGLTNLATQLRRLVAHDPVNCAVLGTTAMGLVELTRERRGPSVAELSLDVTFESAPLAVGLRALRLAVAESRHRPGKALTLVLAPEVAAVLNANPQAVSEARQRIGLPLAIRAERGRGRDDIDLQEGTVTS